MSSLSFYDQVKVAIIEKQTTMGKLVIEINEQGICATHNYIYQVLKKQRTNDAIVNWFRDRLDLPTAIY